MRLTLAFLTLTAVLAQTTLAQSPPSPRSAQHINEPRQNVSIWSKLRGMIAMKRYSSEGPPTFEKGGHSGCQPCKPHRPCNKPCKQGPQPVPECLDYKTARKLAETFEYFFINLDGQVATAVLAQEFQYISDSDNTLQFNGTSKAPGTITYDSRAAFVSGLPSDQFRAAPDPYVIEDVFHSCKKVAYRWVVPGGFSPPSTPSGTIRGITLLETSSNGTFYKITRAHTEYNNLLTAADVNRCDVCSKITGL